MGGFDPNKQHVLYYMDQKTVLWVASTLVGNAQYMPTEIQT